MPDVVDIAASPKPEFKLPPEEEEAIRVRSLETGRKIANALVSGVNVIVDAKAGAQQVEIEALKARVERLERLLAPRLAEAEGE